MIPTSYFYSSQIDLVSVGLTLAIFLGVFIGTFIYFGLRIESLSKRNKLLNKYIIENKLSQQCDEWLIDQKKQRDALN